VTRLAAVATGLALATLPFLMFLGDDAHDATPHADHAPRHGGRLVMVGDHHLELVERDTLLEVYVSDAVRRPLRPSAARLVDANGAERALGWADSHVVVTPPLEGRLELTLDGGAVLAWPVR
jgi:hypothetical protein